MTARIAFTTAARDVVSTCVVVGVVAADGGEGVAVGGLVGVGLLGAGVVGGAGVVIGVVDVALPETAVVAALGLELPALLGVIVHADSETTRTNPVRNMAAGIRRALGHWVCR